MCVDEEGTQNAKAISPQRLGIKFRHSCCWTTQLCNISSGSVGGESEEVGLVGEVIVKSKRSEI